MPGPAVGHSMKLYYSTADPATPVWTEIGDVGDVAIADFSVGAAEFKRRGNNWTKNLPTLFQSVNITARLPYDVNTTVFNVLRGLFLARTIFELAVMSGVITTTGEQGLRCAVFMNQFPWDQPLEEVAGHDLSFVIAYKETNAGTEVDPTWMVI